MTNAEQREAARKFINTWRGKGDEKSDAQSFWISLLSSVLGMDSVTDRISFEKKVVIGGQTKYIDAYIPETKVLIEQKSFGISLSKSLPQSGGVMMTPYEQGKNYANNLPADEVPRWIVTCNFAEFNVYDMNKPGTEPEVIMLDNLQNEIYRFDFLLNKKVESVSKEQEISIQAGNLVGDLYDALLKEYKDPTNEDSLKSLNALCVRLVFCLYAEDAGIFGKHGMFHDYLMRFEIRDLRKALIELFQVLDIKPEDRDPYMDKDLAAFPYVNGGLFSDGNIEIPQLTEEIRELILKKASADFDWSEISPTIFGAVFESTLNPETRRAGGMHYTSIENIHKVIDPLFLDDLKEELEKIRAITVTKTKKSKLENFQEKLAGLHFLDPACGSGNFLTESYISLRKIENEILKMKMEVEKGQVAGQIMLGDFGSMESPIKVSIGQFYGIEINDFAVTVAKTALWIAESQMMKATEDVVHMNLDFLPLKSYANIVEGNALRMDWNDVISKEELDYIMGNPPFHGFTFMTAEQKSDMQLLFPGVKNLDFVCAWFKMASDYIADTKIEVAYVATNSIVQGETVSRFWDFMEDDKLNFAYKTFVWDSEATLKAHVHCVIIGFAKTHRKIKYLFDGDEKVVAQNINYYLIDGENILVRSRNKPICAVPKMIYGNKPADGGNLIIEDEDYNDFIAKDPYSKKFIHPLIGASEYIKGKKRWCLWLDGVSPEEIKKCPLVLEHIKACKEVRENSIAAGIRKFAATPMLFAQRTQPIGKDFIIVPRVSSQARRYIPMGFMKAGTIVTDRVQIIPDASLYDFGVITSNVHMAWTRVVCMRLKSDYSYSKDIVYNNFPWPQPDESQKRKIEQTAQAILDARALYHNSSLADLYGEEMYLYPELMKAHQANDRAVMQAYGFDIKEMSEADCVAELMKMYQKLVEE